MTKRFTDKLTIGCSKRADASVPGQGVVPTPCIWRCPRLKLRKLGIASGVMRPQSVDSKCPAQEAPGRIDSAHTGRKSSAAAKVMTAKATSDSVAEMREPTDITERRAYLFVGLPCTLLHCQPTTERKKKQREARMAAFPRKTHHLGDRRLHPLPERFDEEFGGVTSSAGEYEAGGDADPRPPPNAQRHSRRSMTSPEQLPRHARITALSGTPSPTFFCPAPTPYTASQSAPAQPLTFQSL